VAEVEILMVQPFDYTLNVQDPVLAMQQGMAFGQNQRAGEQAMVMGQQNMDLAAAQEGRAQTAFGQNNMLFDQAQQDRAAALEKAQAQQADLTALYEGVVAGNVGASDFAAMITKNPEMATELGAVFDLMEGERKKSDVAELVKGVTAIKSGRPDLAIQMLEDRAVAAENSGDKMEADISRAMAAAIKADPNAGLTSLGLLLQVADPEASQLVFGTGRRVQSTAPYANGTTVTVFSDGSKEVTDATGAVLSGQAAQDAVKAAMDSEAEMRGANAGAAETAKLDAKIEKSGEAAASEEAGKQAIAKSGEAFDSLNKALSNIANVDVAIAALDAGAKAGVIDKYFPDITAASASLTNAMNRLGLDVIGSVTFGALSEGEMKLAMETAVPRNLNEADLRKWLVDKKAAQTKAAEALRAAAIYLGTPGNTLAKWLESKGTIAAPSAPAAGSGSPEATDQPGASDLDALLREAEGL
jgi:hypothetical protein